MVVLYPFVFLIFFFLSSSSSFFVSSLLLPSSFPSAGFFKVDSCMVQIQGRVCDPDGLLDPADRARVDAELVELEQGTTGPGMSALSTFREPCPPAGLKLLVLLFRELADPENIRDLHWRYTEAHPCERTAVIMLSPGPDLRTERFLSGVWSKFYGISSQNAGISPEALLREYRNAILMVRRGEIAAALVEMIRASFKKTMTDSVGGVCRSHLNRSRSCATLLPESWADHPFPKLTRVHSSADIAQRYSAINSPTRYWPRYKPYYWPLSSNLCNIVSNYSFYPLFRSYWPSYRSYLLDTNWYNRRFDRFQFQPPDSYYSFWPMKCSYHYWYHYPYFKRWYLGGLGGFAQMNRQ